MVIPTKDKRELFMRQVYLNADMSKDIRTRIGAVLVKEDNVVSMGFNGFPRKVKDLESRYNNRPVKHLFVVHAEENSVLAAARHGISTFETTLYTNGYPCCSCFKCLIQAGVKKVVIHKQWPELDYDQKWIDSVNISKEMAREAEIEVEVYDKVLGMMGMLDGKIINV